MREELWNEEVELTFAECLCHARCYTESREINEKNRKATQMFYKPDNVRNQFSKDA